MSSDQIILTLVITAVMTLFITRWVRIEVAALLTIAALPLFGLVEPSQALAGFSSPATITIASMFVLSAAISHTGSLDFLRDTLRKHARGSKQRLMLLLAAFVPLSSAFVNNTPVVVMLVPVVLELARDMEEKPSRLLIPLSYLAILGGTCTLVGTNTNIVVHELYRNAGGPGFGMFDFTPLGIVYLTGGVLFMLLVGQRLLPDRTSLSAMLSRKSTAKFVTELCVPGSSKLVGMKAGELFAKSKKIRLLEIVREETVILAPKAGDVELEADDALLIEGGAQQLASFMQEHQVELPTAVADGERVQLQSMELMLGEAVVLPMSSFVGQTLAELGLNRRYGVKVLAVMRRGKHHRYNLRTMVLRPGDVLFIQADESGFEKLRDADEVLIVDETSRTPTQKKHRWVALGTMGGVVAAATFTSVSLMVAAVLGVAIIIMTRCIRFNDALKSIDTTVFFILAGTIPLGIAMEETGLATLLVDNMLNALEGAPPMLLLSLFYLLTAGLTQLLSNQACAVLLTPVALNMAVQLGIDPKPLLMAICFGASASFMTPLGYATNTIVMGPGGYTFFDYVRIGLPLQLLTWLMATFLIPVMWPMYPTS